MMRRTFCCAVTHRNPYGNLDDDGVSSLLGGTPSPFFRKKWIGNRRFVFDLDNLNKCFQASLLTEPGGSLKSHPDIDELWREWKIPSS